MDKRIYPPEILWIKKNKDVLSIYLIEKKLGMPQKTLNNFVRGFYGLNERWWPGLVKWVSGFVEIGLLSLQITTEAKMPEKKTSRADVMLAPAVLKNCVSRSTKSIDQSFLEKRRAGKLK